MQRWREFDPMQLCDRAAVVGGRRLMDLFFPSDCGAIRLPRVASILDIKCPMLSAFHQKGLIQLTRLSDRKEKH